ncbi:MAG: hypothetical protein MJ107_06255 [Lachnospiraceae bacterium]|nr:hypothetical protein [Lachnospiraceae bacterium]
MIETQNIITRRLEELPNEKLRISHTRGKPSYYKVLDGQKEYLSRKETELISQLAECAYLEKLSKEITNQTKTISYFLKNYSETSLSDIYHNMSSDRKNLINPIYISNEEYAAKWQEQSYIPKQFAINEREYITNKGERVRSKSEKIIADRLYYLGIPYKYECPLTVKGYGTLYPDFTVLNICTRKEYYWEHLGMMDNDQYCENALSKLDTYQSGGIIPGKQLILTYETSKKPLNINHLNQVIEEFLVR